MSRLIRLQRPQVPIMSLAAAKASMRVDTAADDANISEMIDAVEGMLDGAEGLLGRCLNRQTWRYEIEDFPEDGFDLPLPPLISVTSVDYLDLNADRQTLSTDIYRVIDGGLMRRSRIIIQPSQYWPTVYTEQPDGVRVTFEAGYTTSTSPDDSVVPAPIIQAAKLMLRRLYDDPGSRIIVEAERDLLAPFRVAILGSLPES